MARPEVKYTAEFQRVEELPRRTPTLEEAEAYAEVLAPEIVCRGADVYPRAWQAFVIAEAIEWRGDGESRFRGGFFGLPVGFGKTIPMYTIPRLIESKRPLVIVPGQSLVDKTKADFDSFCKRWKPPNPLPRIVTQESLHGKKGETFLSDMKPDYIALEEADEWANPIASHSRRLDRYIVEAQDGVAVYAFTGSPTRKSLLGYGHILRWCLRDLAPVPMIDSELGMWAAAIDDYGQKDYQVRRPGPGPMGVSVKEARMWFARRLAETPGVVLIDGDSAGDVPLTINWRFAKECPVLDRHFEMVMKIGQGEWDESIPEGLVFSDPLSRWRIDAQLGCGYFRRYVSPGPPDEWRIARRNKDAFVRWAIADSASDPRPLDTELQVLNRYPDEEAVREWKRVCAEFGNSFPTEAVRVSTATVETAVEWLRERDEPSIIWTGGTEFALWLAAATRLPYYGAQGKDENGRGLHVADPRKSMIVSWHANKRGFNLQAWRRNAVFHPPQSAKFVEQMMGRPHRSGQDREVTFDWFMTSGGTISAFRSAESEARFAKQTVGLTQKILRARINRAEPRRTRQNRFRWAA